MDGSGVYIFQIENTFMTSANSEIRVINSAEARCILLQVGNIESHLVKTVFLSEIFLPTDPLCSQMASNTKVPSMHKQYVSFIADTLISQRPVMFTKLSLTQKSQIIIFIKTF
jgi:hypothetical protein